MSIIVNDYITRIPHPHAMVFRRLRAALRWVRDYVYDFCQICRGYEPCINDDCEYYVHVDELTYPECRQCYREHDIRGLTDYVMHQFTQNNFEHERELRTR